MKKHKKSEAFEGFQISDQEESSSLDAKLEGCPASPGVYLMKNEAGHVIYVGKAKSLRQRVRSYFQRSAQHSPKTLFLVSQIRDIQFLRTESEVEALLLENNLIKRWRPKFNIRLKDDKTYPYIKLDLTHPFPRAQIARKQVQGDGAEYFGPYVQGSMAYEALTVATKVFLMRDCREHEFANRSRPCLSYQIGQCTAPCVGLVSQEAYATQVAGLKDFLRGVAGGLEDSLREEMEKAAESLQYEKAARLRDRLVHLQDQAQKNQRMVDTVDHENKDVWSVWPEIWKMSDQEIEEVPLVDVLVLQFRAGKWIGQHHYALDIREAFTAESFLPSVMLQHYSKHDWPTRLLVPEKSLGVNLSDFSTACSEEQRELYVSENTEREDWIRLGELARENVRGLHEDEERARSRFNAALMAIARMVDLPKLPVRMECVDISNFQGEENVASAVVFLHGQPAKNEYRHYKIKGFEGQNDFASMREVMIRRYGKPDSPKPDLLVIDGGKGQLAAALTILKELGCTFPVVGLAKARTQSNFTSSEIEVSAERLFLPNVKNPKPIKDAGALRVLTHLRDEAHRFAITFHRQRRDRARFES